MQEYNIEIKNEKIISYRLITFFLVALNILFFIYNLIDPVKRKSALISLGFVLLYIFYRVYKSQKNQQSFHFDEWIYFLLMILWADNTLVAILCMLLFLSYAISLQKIIYSFDNSRIKQKNFPWKKYDWTEVSNVILKDNLLTIDLKNNKLLQAEIIDAGIDEKQFNQFVRERL